MASRRIFVVFVLPIVLSVTLAGAVMADVLDKPGRELQMWPQPSSHGGHGDGDGGGDGPATAHPADGPVRITGLSESYVVGERLVLRVSVDDGSIDCGDLYITIHYANGAVLSQGAFFAQCLADDGASLPVGDDFVAVLDTPGAYTVVAEVRSDKGEAVSALGEFVVVGGGSGGGSDE